MTAQAPTVAEPRTVDPLGDLAAALLVLTLAIAVAWSAWLGPFRSVVVLPVLLVAPGYLVLRAAFGPAGRTLDPLARLSVSVVLSLTAQPLLAIAADTLGFRLTLRVVCGANLLLGLACSLVGRRRDRRTALDRPVPTATQRRTAARRRVNLAGYAVAVASAVALAVLVGAHLPAPPTDGYSQVFLGESLRGGETIQVTPGQSFALPLIATNETATGQDYTVHAYVDDRRALAVLRAHVDAGGTWEGTLALRVPSDRCLHRLTAVFTPVGTTAESSSTRTLTVYVQGAPIGSGCRAH